MKVVLASALALLLSARAAGAQTCTGVPTLPTNLTNGTTADATQVMANFNYLLGCINGLRGYIGGLTLSNDATNPNTVIDTAAGIADSDDVTTMMQLSASAKNANAAWAAGSGNGCLDAGSGLAANTWYHLFVIARTDTGIVDELCSTSATAPTLPASYSKKRRIGSFKTDGSSHIIAFVEKGDRFDLVAAVTEYNGNPGSTLAATQTLAGVPTGVAVEAILSGNVSDSSTVPIVYLSSLAQADTAPSVTAVTAEAATGGIGAFSGFRIETSSAAQIRRRVGGTTTNLLIITNGWIDTRGRFQ